MDFSALSNLSPYIGDIILILISGSAVLYCAVLSRRLKQLNNLKKGVGASIVSLTSAIEKTHEAAQDAQTSTLQTVKVLRNLLEKAESAAPKIEALVTELDRSHDLTKDQRLKLNRDVEFTLSPAIEKAQKTASGLLKIVSDIDRYKQTLSKQKEMPRTETEDIDTNVLVLKDAVP